MVVVKTADKTVGGGSNGGAGIGKSEIPAMYWTRAEVLC